MGIQTVKNKYLEFCYLLLTNWLLILVSKHIRNNLSES